MANYVNNRVVCTKEVLNTYFIDYSPISPDKVLEEPYISFNKLFGIQSLGEPEYREQYGEHIYYGNGFSWKKQDNGLYEIKFTTRWQYPIQAILRAVELSHDTVWYAVEENDIYVSKFHWHDGVQEDVVLIDEDSYWTWREGREDFDDTLDDDDDMIWYYLEAIMPKWRAWKCEDLLERYRDKAMRDIDLPDPSQLAE